ncbi:MAG TPA: TonB-dependent receptor [Vicinamibacterales bacterium]|nr:TonB-dependent receptor [Vicinamibacterales bacterium]
MLRSLSLLLAALLVTSSASAQTHAASGTIDGYVTTQGKTIPLGGAQVVVRNSLNEEISTVVTEGDGHFRVIALADGRYRVSVTLAGFEPTTVQASVATGGAVDLAIDLPIAAISQTVEVVGSASIATGTTLAPTDSIGGRDIDQYAAGGFQAALRLLASIIEVPGGLSIKGGRPSQAGVQIGAGTLVDPSTGLPIVSLPDDAIDSVAVLPNPYAVEYGRFSSGLVVIQTRRAGDKWKTRLNNLDPTFRTARGTMFDITGISAFAPRLETGGPIVKDQLFLEQTAQFRYATSDVPSRPEDELKTTRWFSSFSRVDWNLSPRHSIVGTGGFFPSVETWATLGTFTPPDATADIHAHVNHGGVSERALWSDSLFSETTVQVHEAQTDVLPQGTLPMRLLPETTLGNFYNAQYRRTATYQVVETVSGSRNIGGGLHLYKAGFDALYSRYDGTSVSRPVLIDRSDGSLARRLDFTGSSAQSVGSADIALFAQDRFQPNGRWYLEFGGRLDRDGVVDRLNVTPRVGTAILLDDAGASIVRGGFGLFYERTPSTVGAFEQFESALDTRFADDGQTVVGQPIRFAHATAPDLETPRSRTWDIAFDHRINQRWSLHAGAIDRTGDHELVVDPVRARNVGALVLSSSGRSKYREEEIGIHFTHGPAVDLNASYVHSTARGDLNALTNYYDAVMWPIVGENAYAPLAGDVPHRLLARGRVMPTPRWLLLGIFDWRTGMPWSPVNEYLDFVGPRNELFRFPAYARTEIGIEHRFRMFKLEPWIGVRAYNAFNAFLPTDVQANLTSPSFGSFYNSEYRQLRLQFRFER